MIFFKLLNKIHFIEIDKYKSRREIIRDIFLSFFINYKFYLFTFFFVFGFFFQSERITCDT
jgi:hypothetical protein